MKQLPSRFRRLDDALADLPLDEPMLLTELDATVLQLHAARLRNDTVATALPASVRPAKVERNEPCRCRWGKKSKRCCR